VAVIPEVDGSASGEDFAWMEKALDTVKVWSERVHLPCPAPAPGSSLAADDAAARPYEVSSAVVGGLVSAVDHLDALRVLVVEAAVVHSRAPYTLLRAALENAATAVWLLAPANRKERVLRRLRLKWADYHDHVQASALTDEPMHEWLPKVKIQLREIAENRGMDQDQIKRVTDRPPSLGSIVETAGEELDGLSGRKARFFWAVGSGIAHDRDWATLAGLQSAKTHVTHDGVAHGRFSASGPALIAITHSALLMTAKGWRLFDQRRQTHIR
jgi:hypothetical protein